MACLEALRAGAWGAPPKGLLAWWVGADLPFPLHRAAARLNALHAALAAGDACALQAAALRLLGLGPGLTPSGDDVLGGALFALAHGGDVRLKAALPGIRSALLACATHPEHPATNPISAALLGDLMAGCSHRALHALLDTWHEAAAPDAWQGLATTPGDRTANAVQAVQAVQAVLSIGASSGADMLTGVLMGLLARHHAPRRLVASSHPNITSALTHRLTEPLHT